MFRVVLAFTISRRDADEAVGRLTYDLIRLPFIASAGVVRAMFRLMEASENNSRPRCGEGH